MVVLNSRTVRGLAAAIALSLAVAAAPPVAFAEVDNIWTDWAGDVLDRRAKYEIPAAVILSIPAMIMITPIWLGQLALDGLREMGGEDEAEDE